MQFNFRLKDTEGLGSVKLRRHIHDADQLPAFFLQAEKPCGIRQLQIVRVADLAVENLSDET